MTLPAIVPIGSASGGEKTVLDGTEQIPIDGSQFALISSILTYIADNIALRFAVASSNYAPTTVANAANDTLILDTELVDDDNLITLSGNNAVVAETGWYEVNVIAVVDVTAGPFVADGNYSILVANSGVSDNTNVFVATQNGIAAAGNCTVINSTMYLLATETVHVVLVNNTGVSLDGYVQEVRFTKLRNT